MRDHLTGQAAGRSGLASSTGNSGDLSINSIFCFIFRQLEGFAPNYQARALRALGLLLADGTPTVGGGKTF